MHNVEIEANEMFTRIREKNAFRQGEMPTTATTFTDVNKRRNRGGKSVDIVADEIYRTPVADVKYLI